MQVLLCGFRLMGLYGQKKSGKCCVFKDRIVRKSDEILLKLVAIKVVLHTFLRGGVPVREDSYPEPSACEVGWPVPFLAAFISPVFPLGTHMLLGEQ